MKLNKEQLKEFVIKTLKENEELINENAANFGLKKDEKLTSVLIHKEISKLKEKDKDTNKSVIQGLTADDKRLLKKLNLAKVLDKKRNVK